MSSEIVGEIDSQIKAAALAHFSEVTLHGKLGIESQFGNMNTILAQVIQVYDNGRAATIDATAKRHEAIVINSVQRLLPADSEVKNSRLEHRVVIDEDGTEHGQLLLLGESSKTPIFLACTHSQINMDGTVVSKIAMFKKPVGSKTLVYATAIGANVGDIGNQVTSFLVAPESYLAQTPIKADENLDMENKTVSRITKSFFDLI